MIVVSGGSASYPEASGLSRGQMAGIPLNLQFSSAPTGRLPRRPTKRVAATLGPLLRPAPHAGMLRLNHPPVQLYGGSDSAADEHR
jgi:hypothetical protein